MSKLNLKQLTSSGTNAFVITDNDGVVTLGTNYLQLLTDVNKGVLGYNNSWSILGNAFSARGIFGSSSGAHGWDEVINGVVIGGVNTDKSRFFGTTESFSNTFYSYKSQANTDATFHTDFRNLDNTSLFSVRNDGRLAIRQIGATIGVYGSMSETVSGQAYIIGNSVIAHPINNNQVIKTSADAGIWIRQLYSAGITFHAGLAGGSGTLASDDVNLILTVSNSKNIGIGDNPNYGGGVGVVSITDAATLPTTNPSGGGLLYSEGGAMTWKASGNTSATFGLQIQNSDGTTLCSVRNDGLFNINGNLSLTTNSVSGTSGIIKVDNLTADRIYQFPNNSGTLALLSDIVGGNTTAGNGLTILDNTVKLGGTLTENTTINSNTFNLNFSGSNGIKYLADYSSNYTNRTLVDKQYVDNQISLIPSGNNTTAGNGLSMTGGLVKLGGTLTDVTTTINLDSKQLRFVDGANKIISVDERQLINSSGNIVQNWQNGILYDGNGVKVIDYNSSELANSGVNVFSWKNKSSVTNSNFLNSEISFASYSAKANANVLQNLNFANSNFWGDLQTATLTANRTYTLPNTSGTVALVNDNLSQFSAFVDIGEPASPNTGELEIYARSVGGKMLLKQKGPSGLDTPLQPALFTNNIVWILPETTTTVRTIGIPNTVVGAISTPTISNTNLRTSIRRILITSGSAINSVSEMRTAQNIVWRGNASGLGGFFYASRFAIESTVATQRVAVGLWNSTAATFTTQSPSSLVDAIFMGWDDSDTNAQLMHNDASGACTKIDLGSAFVKNTSTAVYELILFAAPNGADVGYRVSRLDTGDIVEGLITTNLPQSNQFLTRHEYINNGATASAVLLNVIRVYIETDY